MEINEHDRALASKWIAELHPRPMSGLAVDARDKMAAEIAACRERWHDSIYAYDPTPVEAHSILDALEKRVAEIVAERDALRERVAKLEAIVQRLAGCTDMGEAITLKHEAAALLAPRLP